VERRVCKDDPVTVGPVADVPQLPERYGAVFVEGLD
jgi:hypothetical protein